jgi:anaerobic magnesium-protoporphyrin IX monomethyl ester cyclase
LEFCRGFAKRFPGLTFDVDSRVDTVDEETIRALKEAGCVKMAFGVESGSERILDALGKKITPGQVERAFKLCRKAGILTQAYVMVGYPDETAEEIGQTRKLLRRIGADLLHLSILTPYPGTAVEKVFRDKGLLDETRWENYSFFPSGPGPDTLNFRREELIAIRNSLTRGFYFSPWYVGRRLARIRGAGELLASLKGAYTLARFTS